MTTIGRRKFEIASIKASLKNNKAADKAALKNNDSITQKNICRSVLLPERLEERKRSLCTFGTRYIGILQSSSAHGLCKNSASIIGNRYILPHCQVFVNTFCRNITYDKRNPLNKVRLLTDNLQLDKSTSIAFDGQMQIWPKPILQTERENKSEIPKCPLFFC